VVLAAGRFRPFNHFIVTAVWSWRPVGSALLTTSS
jgi:hypothetical protein